MMLALMPLLTLHRSDYSLWIKSFGAVVTTEITRRTTHVIANPDRKTSKVKKAARYPHIKIVNPEWMFQCCTRWEHVEEAPYLIEIDPAERDGSPFGELEDDSMGATGDDEPEGPAESPVSLDLTEENWESFDAELAEFMNETDTDEENESDSDSVRSDKSTTSDANPNKKRKRETKSTDVSEAEESDASTPSASKLQRRKKRTMERVTSLTNVTTLAKSSGLPSPETTGPEEGQAEDDEKGPETNGVGPDLQDDDDDALEAELMAGFGASDDEA
jgi:RNA polymerase II subunit A-like phosphatase